MAAKGEEIGGEESRSRCALDELDVLWERRHVAAFPQDIELVQGAPRSRLLAANLFALRRHLPLTDAEGLLECRVMTAGMRLGPIRVASSERSGATR